MTNLAVMVQHLGISVSGYDTNEAYITQHLIDAHHITLITELNPSLLPEDVDVVCYSPAHGGTSNPFVLEAKRRKIPIIAQTALIASIMEGYTHRIAVCGCHGKTSTSGLLAYMLTKLGMRPGYIVGTPQISGLDGGAVGGPEYFVVEADEYGVDVPRDITPKFSALDPTEIIATNIDFDHPDVYKNVKETQNAFIRFFRKTLQGHQNAHIYSCCDDKPLHEAISSLHDRRIITYGLSTHADYRVEIHDTTEEYTSFILSTKNTLIGPFSVQFFGEKQVVNCAGVIALLLEHGFDAKQIQTYIRTFSGTMRRFEFVAQIGTTWIFDDYAHHPAEISATIRAARLRFPRHKLSVIFQPHTYSRTRALEREFITALSKADAVYVAPIFASAREKKSEYAISNMSVVKKAQTMGFSNFVGFESSEELAAYFLSMKHEKQVILTMGAGDVYKLKNDIILALESRKIIPE